MHHVGNIILMGITFFFFFAILYNAETCPMWKIFSVLCGSALYKFYCICFSLQGLQRYRQPPYSEPHYSILSRVHFNTFVKRASRGSSVGMATGCGLDGRDFGFRLQVGSRILTSPKRPDRLGGPPGFLSNGRRGSLPGGKAAGP
jgi:hypothetical protein